MRSAQKLLKKTGISIFIVLLLIGVVKDYVLVPLMSKGWGWALTTTPDGFISNANVLETMKRSPWIFLIGFVLLLIYTLFAMWEMSAALLGIAYGYQGQNVKMVDLFKISWSRVRKAAYPGNWMVLIFTAIILPFSNMYQATEFIGAFVVPEYVDEFIHSRIWLLGVYFLLALCATYLTLRWLYVLPSFILKNKGFAYAKEESRQLTRKGWIRNGIKISIYQLMETIRLGAIPYTLVTAASIGCLYFTYEMQYSLDLISSLGFSIGFQFIGTIVSRLVYISVMCYLAADYAKKLMAAGETPEFDFPELTRQSRQHHSVIFCEIWTGIAVSILVTVCYLILVYASEIDAAVLDPLYANTEVIAHKGYSSKAPENTMPAFELADQSENVDYIELDVWSSREGVPVVIHNETIKAATGEKGSIYHYSSEQLQKIPAPYAMNPADFPDAYIPTLEEVLKTYADSTPILIEIKGYHKDPQLPEKIINLMRKYECTSTCMIHSQSYEALRVVKELDPDIRCGLILAFVSGEYYDLPYVDFFSVEHTFLTRGMVRQLHLRGKKVYVWTVNHAASVGKLRSMSVDGIITDYPDSMAGYTTYYSSSTRRVLNDIFREDYVDPESILQSLFLQGEY